MTQLLITKAIDPGFGGIKVAWLEDGRIKTRVIPSVVGLGQVKSLKHIGLGPQRKLPRPLSISFGNGINYLVGDGMHYHAEPVEDLDHWRLSEGLANQALLYAALGSGNACHNGNGRSQEISVMLGFPVEVLSDEKQARVSVRSVRALLQGRHRFSLDGRPVDLQINQVKVVAQPLGAFFDWGLDEHGEWIRENEAMRKPVAICDVGFNTVDLFAVENSAITGRYTAGADLGMHRVARAVQRHLLDHHGVHWSLHQADELVRQYLTAGSALVSCADGEIDLSGLIAQALENTFTGINDFVSAHWSSGRQFYRTLITGGGAKALRDLFLRRYPTAYLPPDPIVSNVQGMLKWALRVMQRS